MKNFFIWPIKIYRNSWKFHLFKMWLQLRSKKNNYQKFKNKYSDKKLLILMIAQLSSFSNNKKQSKKVYKSKPKLLWMNWNLLNNRENKNYKQIIFNNQILLNPWQIFLEIFQVNKI